MENIDNSLSHRQVAVVRKNLVSVFRFAVKALIDKACFSSIDDGCEEFINFSASMEHILQHRLRPSKMWYLGDDRSHFWFYIKAACRRQDLRSCITNIDNIENIRSPVAKGRAFLRCALMEKRLSDYLSEALSQSTITKRYYRPGAIMLGEEASELCGVLLGLNSIDFGFCLKGENYDTVECPLVISYTPFMRFKQSHESLHSDLEEMRELSCGSSLASEDGHDTHEASSPDSWPERYNALHRRYMRVLEQKSFLEEVTATQEKALQSAATMQREDSRLQQEAAVQKRQYEAVILELQAQVARMKTINETLQQQLVLARSTQLPMSEMEGRRDGRGEASRFAAAMAYKQDSDRHSLTSSYDRSSGGKTGDTRSLTSAVSEISVDIAGPGQAGGAAKQGEDTQSMVPLTGSLGDLHLDLETGSTNTGTSESSATVTNPEQATPVVSISMGAYTITFMESGEVNGNSDDDNVHIRDPSLQDSPRTQVSFSRGGDGARAPSSQERSESEAQVTSAGREEVAVHTSGPAMQGVSPEKDTSATGQQVTGAESAGDEVAEVEQSDERRAGKEMVPQEGDTIKGNQQDSTLVLSSQRSEENSKGAESGAETPVAASQMKSEHVSEVGQDGSDVGSEDSKTSEAEVLVPESDTGEGAAASSDRDTSDPEVLSHGEMTSSKESTVSSSDKDVSEPELLSHEGDTNNEEAAAGTDNREEAIEPEIPEQAGATTGQEPSTGSGAKDSPAEQAEDGADKEGGVRAETADGSHLAVGERGGAISSSDSGSSDGNKDTWDMLSDSAHDSN